MAFRKYAVLERRRIHLPSGLWINGVSVWRGIITAAVDDPGGIERAPAGQDDQYGRE